MARICHTIGSSKVKALRDFPTLVQNGIDDLRSLSMWPPDCMLFQIHGDRVANTRADITIASRGRCSRGPFSDELAELSQRKQCSLPYDFSTILVTSKLRNSIVA